MEITHKHIIFDWGDTLMRDDPARDDAMFQWPKVHVIDCAQEVLRELSECHTITVATSAARSNGGMVRKAFERVGLNEYITHIFTGKRIGRKKSEPEFWKLIQAELNVMAGDILVVGDSFENDVLIPASCGMTALWFNPSTTEERTGERYSTIHSLRELID